MNHLKSMKEQLICKVQEQFDYLDVVDTKELGEVIDMIKDIAEAEYYCTITKAMEEKDKEERSDNIYYHTMPYPDYDRERMHYSGSKGNGSEKSAHMPEMMAYDPREGRAKNSRKMYMESKEIHKDAATQMKDLEKYLQDLSEDIAEMIKDATPQEKQVLQQKIATLSTKII